MRLPRGRASVSTVTPIWKSSRMYVKASSLIETVSETLGEPRLATCRRLAPARVSAIPSTTWAQNRYECFKSGCGRASMAEKPHWSARRFPNTDRANQRVVLASGMPDGIDAIPIRTDGKVLGATLLAGGQLQYDLGDFHPAYLVPARGSIEVNGIYLGMHDGIAVRDESRLTVSTSEDAEIVGSNRLKSGRSNIGVMETSRGE